MTLRRILATVLIGLAAAGAAADDWPSRPIRVIVPVGAGSTTDIIPRLVLEALSRRLAQPVVVENRAGAGGTIGSAAVARAAPDGYMLLAFGSAHTIAPALYASLAYDPARDFASVAALGSQGSVLLVSSASGWRTAADFVTAARAQPGKLTFSSVGVGSATHLSAERFRSSASIEVMHVPYKGGAEAMMEVAAGRVDFFFAPIGLALPAIRDGKVKALAVNALTRSSVLPDVPTTAEAGYADAEYPIWFAVFAPAGTPRDVVDRLHRETMDALREPVLRDKLAQMGLEPMAMSPAQLDAYVRKEIALNAVLARRAGLTAQ